MHGPNRLEHVLVRGLKGAVQVVQRGTQLGGAKDRLEASQVVDVELVRPRAEVWHLDFLLRGWDVDTPHRGVKNRARDLVGRKRVLVGGGANEAMDRAYEVHWH